MGMAAAEAGMEARIARLESDVGHIRSDMADVKSDVRSLRDKMDVMNIKFSERIDNLGAQLNTKIDSVKDSIAAAKIWALVLYMALAGGTLARGFDWI